MGRRWDKEKERQRKAAYRERKRSGSGGATGEPVGDRVPSGIAATPPPDGSSFGARSLDAPDPELVRWREHVRKVLHAAAIEGADEESARRRRQLRRDPVRVKGVEPMMVDDGHGEWAEWRRFRACRYADFLIERFEEFPDLCPRNFVDCLPPMTATVRQIEGFYGYYRREPGVRYPGAK